METKSEEQKTKGIIERYQIELPRWQFVRNAKYLHELSDNAYNAIGRVVARGITRVLPQDGTIIEAKYFDPNDNFIIPVQGLLFHTMREDLEFKLPKEAKEVSLKLDRGRQTVRFTLGREVFEIGYSYQKL